MIIYKFSKQRYREKNKKHELEYIDQQYNGVDTMDEVNSKRRSMKFPDFLGGAKKKTKDETVKSESFGCV
jgi:hypothetical protein